jgi:hypothetical protein
MNKVISDFKGVQTHNYRMICLYMLKTKTIVFSGSHSKYETTVFWVIVLHSLVEINQHFRGAYCLHHQAQ